MGFGGSVAAMITSLKNNSRRKERVSYFKKEVHPTKGNNGVKLPKATPEQLQRVRNKLKEQQKQSKRIAIFQYIITIILFIILLYLLKL